MLNRLINEMKPHVVKDLRKIGVYLNRPYNFTGTQEDLRLGSLWRAILNKARDRNYCQTYCHHNMYSTHTHPLNYTQNTFKVRDLGVCERMCMCIGESIA